MDHYDLTGYYTYRSLLNQPAPADDFNTLRFAEGELFLYVAPDGSVSGTLAFPADPLEDIKDFMDITGRVTSWAPPTMELEGIGRAGTSTEPYDYKYQGSVAPTYPDAVAQRIALVGTVIRAKPHGTSPAGFTASFIACKRDFLPARQVPGAALIPEAVAMLASRGHRLRHNVWHTVRTQWHALKTDEKAVAEIEKRGWWPKRPPFLETRALNLEQGAGEDFLFMHRRMILMVRDVYAGKGLPPPKGWTILPGTATPQRVYQETTTPEGKAFAYDPEASGFMVPPPARDDDFDRLLKSSTFLQAIMRPIQDLFRSPRFLSGLTLGQLGNLLEFTIHGWMHVRWTHTTYDPKTGEPVGRSSLFDIDRKWDDPANDDLGDFYSSHVNPTFWRLHGWIDDRINDWSNANSGQVKLATIDGVPWFAADGRRVLVGEPFSWPSPGHHQHGGHQHPPHNGDEVRVMEEVMGIMKGVIEPAAPPPAAAKDRAKSVTARARSPLPQPRLAFRETLLGLKVPDLLKEGAVVHP